MVIFVDMDDVIADTYGKHIEMYNTEFGKNLSLSHFKSGEVWQNVPEMHQDSIRRHVRTDGFFRDLEPIKDSISVLKELCEKHEVYIASAATQFPNSLREKSDWLDEYFPFISWHYRIMCGYKFILKGDLLIDDRSFNLDEFDGNTLLFNSPHNVHENTHERVGTWLEIAEKLLF
jgi:5'(3')-deoxyribonucleotidase